jgi:hypothetical protein
MPGIRSASGEARQPVPASTGGALIVPGGPLSGDADTGLNLPDAQTKSLTENPDRAAEAGEVEPEDRDEAPAAVRFLTAGFPLGQHRGICSFAWRAAVTLARCPFRSLRRSPVSISPRVGDNSRLW